MQGMLRALFTCEATTVLRLNHILDRSSHYGLHFWNIVNDCKYICHCQLLIPPLIILSRDMANTQEASLLILEMRFIAKNHFKNHFLRQYDTSFRALALTISSSVELTDMLQLIKKVPN